MKPCYLPYLQGGHRYVVPGAAWSCLAAQAGQPELARPATLAAEAMQENIRSTLLKALLLQLRLLIRRARRRAPLSKGASSAAQLSQAPGAESSTAVSQAFSISLFVYVRRLGLGEKKGHRTPTPTLPLAVWGKVRSSGPWSKA